MERAAGTQARVRDDRLRRRPPVGEDGVRRSARPPRKGSGSVTRLFGHGDLRLWLLKLIDERPRHGYDIIAGLEEQFLGIYSPSPGTVYPRLSALEAEGLIEQVDTEDGRKVYRLTDKGREELHGRRDEVRELTDR